MHHRRVLHVNLLIRIVSVPAYQFFEEVLIFGGQYHIVRTLSDFSNSVPTARILRIVEENPRSCITMANKLRLRYRPKVSTRETGSWFKVEATAGDAGSKTKWMTGCIALTVKSLQVQRVPTQILHILLSSAQYNTNGSICNTQYQSLNHVLIY